MSSRHLEKTKSIRFEIGKTLKSWSFVKDTIVFYPDASMCEGTVCNIPAEDYKLQRFPTGLLSVRWEIIIIVLRALT